MTYPFLTPTAAQGIISCIYDHPGVWSDVRRIIPVRLGWIVRLGNVQQASLGSVRVRDGSVTAPDGERRPTVQTVIRDGAWIVEFDWRFDPTMRAYGTPPKWAAIFNRRLSRGEAWFPPRLGLHDYRAFVRPVEDDDRPIRQTRDFGHVIHGFDRMGPIPRPLMFHAMMRDGVIEVPSLWERVHGSRKKGRAA